MGVDIQYPLCSLLPSAVVVLGCGLNGYLNTEPNRVFGALGYIHELLFSRISGEYIDIHLYLDLLWRNVHLMYVCFIWLPLVLPWFQCSCIFPFTPNFFQTQKTPPTATATIINNNHQQQQQQQQQSTVPNQNSISLFLMSKKLGWQFLSSYPSVSKTSTGNSGQHWINGCFWFP